MSVRANRWVSALFMCSAILTASAAELEPVTPDTFLLRGNFPEGRQPDGNSLVLTAPDGFIVFDTGRHRAHTQAIIDFARARSRPVVTIVNSHWHLDHVGGNALLRKTYPKVQVLASDAIRGAQSGFLREYRQQLQDAIASAAANDEVSAWRAEVELIDAGTDLAPNAVVTRSQPMTIAGRKLIVHLESNAATAGDVWIEDPARRVVLSGDLVTLPVPFLDTACASGWSSALTHVAATSFATLVPGHGAPMNRAGFDRYQRAFETLRTCAASDRTSQACAQEWIDGLGDVLDAADVPRVPKLMDYYVKLLRTPARNCKS